MRAHTREELEQLPAFLFGEFAGQELLLFGGDPECSFEELSTLRREKESARADLLGSVEPAREVPGARSEQVEHSRQEEEPDDESVEEDGAPASASPNGSMTPAACDRRHQTWRPDASTIALASISHRAAAVERIPIARGLSGSCADPVEGLLCRFGRRRIV